MVIDALSSYSGGARTYLRAMLPRLAQLHGVRLSVICRDDQREGFGLVTSPTLTWLPVPAFVRPLVARLSYSFGVVPALAARHHGDVLFCPTDHSPLIAPCPTVLMIRNPTPYVDDMDTVVSPTRKVREAAMRAVTMASAWRSQRIILVSQAALAATAAKIPLPHDRVRVIHHGRDSRFAPPATGSIRERDLLLAVGSIYAFKNYALLLDAMAALRARHGLMPRLKIAGAPFDAPHAAWLVQRTQQLGLTSQIEWLGEVPHTQLIDWYQRATVFVMPSRLETFGHPYIEAMATGTPSLVGDISCAREMCGDAVWYAPPHDAEVFAAQLARLLNDPQARESLAMRGPPRAAEFSWDRCAEETAAVLNEARRPDAIRGRAT